MLNSNDTAVKMKKNVFFVTFTALAVALLFCAHLSASPPQNKDDYFQNTGFKFLENCDPKIKGLSPQNWSVVQDKRGVIYVGNNGGLLELDGVNRWVIRVRNDSVRSMAIDEKGNLYIGGNNEIGFFAREPNGSMIYTSLNDRLKDKYKNFSTVWSTLSTKEGVYFHTSKFLFRWDFKQIRVFESANPFNNIYACEGKFFVLQRPEGLKQMVNDSLQLIRGGDAFSEDKICMIVPYHDRTLLIGTRSKGLYLYDGSRRQPFPTVVDDYLIKNEVYHGIRLKSSPGDFALATRLGGLVIIDSRGNLKHIYDKKSGLQDDNAWYVFEDFQGNLWLALNNGIAKIEYATPFSVCDDRSNLPGLVLSVVRHGKHLYAGTSSGLYFLASPNNFRPVQGISDACWSLLSIGKYLLAATSGGVFYVKNDAKEMIIKNRSYVLSDSQKDSNRVWVGTNQGLVSLYFKGGQWVKEREFKNITQEIRTIVEEKEGNLWLGTSAEGVLKVDFPRDGDIANPVVNQYLTLVNRSPPSEQLSVVEIKVFMADGHVIFATPTGLYRFNGKDKFFIPDPTLGDRFADGSRRIFFIVPDRHNHIWFHSEDVNYQAVPGDNGFNVLDNSPLLRLPLDQVNFIYPDPGEDMVWFACHKGLIRYDTREKRNRRTDFLTLIREVEVNGIRLFYDAKNSTYKPGKDREEPFPVIAFKDRNITFRFAAPFFEAESRTQYRCLLEGYDKDWSEWTLETRKNYNKIDPGLNTFRVQAMNVYGNLSSEDVFQFEILPPWYKTWWAFAVYVIIAFMVLFLVVKWRSGKLQREKQKLEQIVKERTKEINEKNTQLETQTLQLKEQAEKLREMAAVKSRFFANISHEFRTPLTLIMGPLEQILSDYRDKDSQLEKKVKLMLRNSQRLFTLINRLLDLSKLDSGKMQLKAARQNMIPFLKGIAASFDLLANQYDLDLTFQTSEEEITLYFDPEKMEDVLCNLLINAVKFTPGGGKITATAKRIPKEEEHFPAGYLEISVSDTGPGIPPGQLAHIFDRFYQSDSTYEHHQKGTGIGLALTRELILLQHGKIDVHSREGENSGTEFIIRLPLGKEHLKPHEIVTSDMPDETRPERRKAFEIPAAYMVEKAEKEGDVLNDVKAGEPGNEIDPFKTEKDIILVVEDSADVREYIRGALEPLYAVVEAKDGQEGIRKAQKIVPDLIISDIMMPGVDGYELCAALKKDIKTSHVPIILLTAKATEENIIRGLETGADDYVTKPFSTKLLMARIKNLIDLRRHFQLTLYREMTQQPVKMSISQMDREFIKELQDMIEKNLSNPDFNVERLGKKLYLSRATLYRKIHALSGESPNEFLQSYRLKRGAELLENNFGSVLEVAFEVGFSSASYFTKCFKKKFNRLPSDFQPEESE
jgi:signal transduction histidine kinase/DNA-binding response OmpR family regulator/ligand-binding sensor domain-containing protein